jgi:hypothetical protein
VISVAPIGDTKRDVSLDGNLSAIPSAAWFASMVGKPDRSESAFRVGKQRRARSAFPFTLSIKFDSLELNRSCNRERYFDYNNSIEREYLSLGRSKNLAIGLQSVGCLLFLWVFQ